MDLGESEEETTCAICNAEFLDAEDLKHHLIQVHTKSSIVTDPSRKKSCDFCKSVFSNSEDYVVHIRDVHITSLKCCKFCTRLFMNAQAFSDHQRKHITVDGSLISCSQCKDTYTVTDLVNHEFKEHSNIEEGVMLNEYFSLLSSFLNVKANTFLHSLHSGNLFVCSICQYTTPDLKDYINHLIQSGCKSFTCDKCFKVYKTRKAMHRHLHDNVACSQIVREKDLERNCQKCKRSIPTSSYFEHIRACKPLKCNLCDVLYESVQKLQEHQREMHPKAIYMTMCKFCRKEFVGTVALQKHVARTHNSQLHLYKYECVHCEDRFFMHPQKLFAHFFSKHNDLKPFTCKICDMQFRVRRKFTIHIKMAHDSKGFVEFDDQYNVFFTPTKSANPFVPKSLFEKPDNGQEDETGASETECETDAKTDVQTDTEKIEGLQSDTNKMPSKTSFLQSDLEGDKTHEGENGKSQVQITKTRKRKSVKSEIETEAEFKSEAETKASSAKTRKSNRIVKKGFVTETEADISDKEPSLKKKRHKPKRLTLINNLKDAVADNSEDSSEEESLIQVKRREKLKRLVRNPNACTKKNRIKKFPNKNKFTCSICNKYCYTFQNYHQHISLHFRDEVKKCIKCEKEFTSKTALIQHIKEDHNTSGLTQTLKSMLQRRKEQKLQPGAKKQLSTAQKFQITIKKVHCTPNKTVAKITKMADDSNVKNFLETFMPEDNATVKTTPDIQSSVTIETLDRPISQPSIIKMIKFEPKSYDINRNHGRKIALPVPFNNDNKDSIKVKVNVSLVHEQTGKENMFKSYDAQYDDGDIHDDNYYQEDHNTSETVPEVAEEQEVTAADTKEESNFNMPHTLVLPKEYLSDQHKNKIRIAHMLPHKPYYKIIKMEDVLDGVQQQQEEDVKTAPSPIELPDGTKLVNVNPLAHLIGDTPIEKLIGKQGKKYYKSKRPCDIPTAIASALQKLESKNVAKKVVKKEAVKSTE